MTLLSRLQDAPMGTRELDAHVEVAVRAIEATRTGLAREHWSKWEACRDGYVQDSHTRYASNPVTTSLDAALALAERVIKTRGPIDLSIMGSAQVVIQSADPCDNPLACEYGNTPALALCAAIIAAKEGT